MNTTITENEISNLEKFNNYKSQMGRLKKAMNAKFYLEALFIEYAVIEDRTEAILRYEENTINAKEGEFVSLNRKLKKILKIAAEENTLANRYILVNVISEIQDWKENRNSLIHALMKQQVTTEEITQIAAKGEELTKQIIKIATGYKRAVERRKKNEVME